MSETGPSKPPGLAEPAPKATAKALTAEERRALGPQVRRPESAPRVHLSSMKTLTFSINFMFCSIFFSFHDSQSKKNRVPKPPKALTAEERRALGPQVRRPESEPESQAFGDPQSGVNLLHP